MRPVLQIPRFRKTRNNHKAAVLSEIVLYSQEIGYLEELALLIEKE